MKLTRRTWLIGGAVALAALSGIAYLARLAPEQRLLAGAISNLQSILAEDASQARTLSAILQVDKCEGLPAELQGSRVELAVAAPDHIRVSGEVSGEKVVVGRDGQELWVWEPGKKFGVIGSADVPRFKGDDGSVEDTRLGPLSLPEEVPFKALGLLPYMCKVEELPGEEIGGEKCRVICASPKDQARKTLGLSAMKLTLALRASDGFPVRIGFTDGGRKNVQVSLHELRVGQAMAEETWKMPAVPEDAKIERVALGHLTRFMDSGLAYLRRPKAQPLGPVTGEKMLVAEHGEGRLEMHDGTRVLFLKGTPEEMGEQHGTLLKDEVGSLVSRMLYGIGVGSSFAKGEWFFGTIESCEARIRPHVDPRYLREMDAMAGATGHAIAEIRLANFFPELFHCSGFALMGDATQGGHLYHGRILDYMKGVGLEPNAVVIVNQPDEGNAWVNVSYAGFTGSVTAMNIRQVAIGEMGGRGEGNWDGKPMAQLVREVMEKAGTLEEAVEIMRRGPRTCEYYYVISDGKTRQAVGIKATPEIFEVINPGQEHPQLSTPIKDAVLMSAGDRYTELVRRVQNGYGKFDADSARELMTRPVCMSSNIHSVLFAPDSLDFWVANSDGVEPAAHMRYTKYNLRELLASKPALP